MTKYAELLAFVALIVLAYALTFNAYGQAENGIKKWFGPEVQDCEISNACQIRVFDDGLARCYVYPGGISCVKK